MSAVTQSFRRVGLLPPSTHSAAETKRHSLEQSYDPSAGQPPASNRILPRRSIASRRLGTFTFPSSAITRNPPRKS